MPWQNQGGNGGGGGNWPGGGRGPWGGGSGGGGGRGPQPPDLEELLRRSQDRVRNLFPRQWGGKGLALAAGVLVALWSLTGWYRVQPDEQGVVLRFGKWVETTQPGLHYHLPSPIEAVLRPQVTKQVKTEIGFRSPGEPAAIGRSRQGAVGDESLILTGDENIVDIDFTVIWRIGNAKDYLFNTRDQYEMVRAVAESAMRDVVGRMPIEQVRTEKRNFVEQETKRIIQATLDEYKAGINIDNVTLQKADPPSQVIDAFKDVQSAKADAERTKNEAEAYQNDIVPRARGEAEKLRQEAEAYREQRLAEAQGTAARFKSVFDEYAQAKDITRQRMYLETLQDVLGRMDKIVIDTPGGTGAAGAGSGVVPYLPLQDLLNKGKGAKQ